MRKNPLEKALSLFVEIRAGEGSRVCLLALNVFLLLGAYYLLKTVREALILSENGAEAKTYSSAGQALLLFAIIPAYGAFASRVNRMKLIGWVTIIFISNLILFYLFALAGAHEGVVFFLWVGIFNVLIVAQFWAFANDLYTEEQGKRLFPAIAVGSALGAATGSEIASLFMERLGPYNLMLVAAGILVFCILLSRSVHRNDVIVKPGGTDDGPHAGETPLGKEGAFELLRQDRYLILIAILTVLLNIVNTSGEFLLSKVVVAEAIRTVGEDSNAQARFIGNFYGGFFTWVNGTGVLLQMFAVSRIFGKIGVRGALFILPCISFTGNFMLLFLPVLGVIRWVKILENSVNYSLQNTIRHTLFLITSREAKYKVKAAIDALFMRIGDVLQAGVVFLGTMAGLEIRGFALINVTLSLVWLGVALLLYREHRRRTEENQVVKDVPSVVPAPGGSVRTVS